MEVHDPVLHKRGEELHLGNVGGRIGCRTSGEDGRLLPPKPSLSLYREHSTFMALDLEHRTYHCLMQITEDVEGANIALISSINGCMDWGFSEAAVKFTKSANISEAIMAEGFTET